MRIQGKSQRLIAFDLDGTLVNAYPAVVASVNHTLKELGFPTKSARIIKRAVGGGDRHLLAQFVGEALADQAIKIYRPHHAKALLTGVVLLPGAKNLLNYLKKQGCLITIASNRPTRFTLLILKVLEIRSVFDFVLCADKAPKPKPYPDILWVTAKRFKVPLQQMLYVGDMTIDIETGHRAGIKTVVVTTGSSTMKELKRLKPKAIIARITDLKKIINKKDFL